MAELFPVTAVAPAITVASDRPVVFHGVNKSGSLAMADVLRHAFQVSGRIDDFYSTYHESPEDFNEFSQLLTVAEGPSFFVSHYIYKGIDIPDDALLVSQVRHPLPRILSVYGWLRYKQLKNQGTLDGFPELARWVEGTHGKRHTQMAQFALGFPAEWRDAIRTMPSGEMRSLALQNLRRDFHWIGLAEYFEESIYMLAQICDLSCVAPWSRDTRNKDRPMLADVEPDVVQLIEDTFSDEFAFYSEVVRIFEQRLNDVVFNGSLGRYKERCSQEYGERLLIDRCRDSDR